MTAPRGEEFMPNFIKNIVFIAICILNIKFINRNPLFTYCYILFINIIITYLLSFVKIKANADII